MAERIKSSRGNPGVWSQDSMVFPGTPGLLHHRDLRHLERKEQIYQTDRLAAESRWKIEESSSCTYAD
jgi:hypothetical protein